MGSLEWHGPARPRRPRSLRNPPILSQGAKLAEKKKKEHCTLHPIRPYSQKLHFKPRTQVMVPMDPSYYAPFSRRTAALLHWKMNGVKKNETEKRHNRCVLSTVKYVHHRVLGGSRTPALLLLVAMWHVRTWQATHVHHRWTGRDRSFLESTFGPGPGRLSGRFSWSTHQVQGRR